MRTRSHSRRRPDREWSPRYASDGHYATEQRLYTQHHFPGPARHMHPFSDDYEQASESFYRRGRSYRAGDEIPPNGWSYWRQREPDYTDRRSGVYESAAPRKPAPGWQGRPRSSSTSTPQQPRHARRFSFDGKRGPSMPPQATEADARKYRIPNEYSLKNWDPTEEPIILLGSVFDANSLGKWIYDWTVYCHGPNTAFSDMAGDLWLQLIQLAGKTKRSEEVVPRIKNREKKELVEDFIEGGERLTDKLRKLLKACESPMLRASKAHRSQLGERAGIKFVETLFGREHELERTERFINSVRTWNVRFDANCEEILRVPAR
ncbi:Vegetative cell wall protein gp1 [Pleurostoma richardsiae]|uniref:Vegetative cell wall protein gp1 n=1 Tax=Pleurostoma richardsiae TaxID=41990 RepID=A0AA38R5C4_9PEZI|nr:Vegetative cell wall protein gp1 [Pleurostoma richardsiae]